MGPISAFDYPPLAGDGIGLIASFGTFLLIQAALALPYYRGWNGRVALALLLFLVLETLGSIAYLKLHYAPVTGAYYSLWIFTLTAGPTFFVSALHLCVHRILQMTGYVTAKYKLLRPSPRNYIMVCLSIDALSLILQIIGGALVGAECTHSIAATRPGFDVMIASMAVQLCSIIVMLLVVFDITISIATYRPTDQSGESWSDKIAVAGDNSMVGVSRRIRRPRVFVSFLVLGLLLNGGILFARAVIRAIELAGGLQGSALRGILLVNVEGIILLVAILVVSVLYPALVLQVTDSNSVAERT